MKIARIETQATLDTWFQRLFGESVLLAGFIQAALLIATYVGIAKLTSYADRLAINAYTTGNGEPMLSFVTLHGLLSLASAVLAGAIAVGLTLLVARSFGVRRAVKMFSVMVLFVAVALVASFAVAVHDRSGQDVQSPSDFLKHGPYLEVPNTLDEGI